jgi:hypothetical protein
MHTSTASGASARHATLMRRVFPRDDGFDGRTARGKRLHRHFEAYLAAMPSAPSEAELSSLRACAMMRFSLEETERNMLSHGKLLPQAYSNLSGVLERSLKSLGIMASQPSHLKHVHDLDVKPDDPRPMTLAEHNASLPPAPFIDPDDDDDESPAL